MPSSTSTQNSPDLLHTRVRDFAAEHGVDTVVLSTDGRMVSFGGSIAVHTAEQIAGIAFALSSYAKRAADLTQREGADVVSVRYATGTLFLLSAARAWVAVFTDNSASARASVAYHAARLAEQVQDLLPEDGLMALPSPLGLGDAQ